MKIKLKFVATLKFDNIKSGDYLEIPTNYSINELLDFLKIKNEHKKYIIAFVNQKEVKANYILKNNDEVSLFLPIGGG